MKELNDKIKVWDDFGFYKLVDGMYNRNHQPPGKFRQIIIQRNVSPEDVKGLNYHQMPGFKLTWKYLDKVKSIINKKLNYY